MAVILCDARGVLHLDFDVAAGWQAQVHERVNRLWRGVGYVDKTLVDPHFELLSSLLVYMRGLNDRESAAVSRQWNWTSNGSSGAERRVYNLFCGLVDNFVIVGLEANTNTLFLIFLGFGCYHFAVLSFLMF